MACPFEFPAQLLLNIVQFSRTRSHIQIQVAVNPSNYCIIDPFLNGILCVLTVAKVFEPGAIIKWRTKQFSSPLLPSTYSKSNNFHPDEMVPLFFVRLLQMDFELTHLSGIVECAHYVFAFAIVFFILHFARFLS